MEKTLEVYDIHWAHVKGHSDNYGNDMADQNAEEGKTKGYFEKTGSTTREWTACEERDLAEFTYLKKSREQRREGTMTGARSSATRLKWVAPTVSSHYL